MPNKMVLIADGGKARFFVLRPVIEPLTQAGPELVECHHLTNSTTNQNPNFKINTDNKNARRAQIELNFAKQVSRDAAKLIRKNHCKTLVVSAEKQMLGLLRKYLPNISKGGVMVTELDKDFNGMPGKKIHNLLTGKGILPPRHVPRRR